MVPFAKISCYMVSMYVHKYIFAWLCTYTVHTYVRTSDTHSSSSLMHIADSVQSSTPQCSFLVVDNTPTVCTSWEQLNSASSQLVATSSSLSKLTFCQNAHILHVKCTVVVNHSIRYSVYLTCYYSSNLDWGPA